jgi:hypothetical protein
VEQVWQRETDDPEAWRTPGRWWAPDEVRVAGGELVPALVTYEDRPYRWRVIHAQGGSDQSAMLGDFVDLADASDEHAFGRYAQCWGMLGLCAHGLPATHDKTTLPESLARPGRSITFDAGLGENRCMISFLGREPIATWRYWARQARALLVVCARLAAGQPGGDAEWDELRAPGPWTRDWPAAPLTIPSVEDFLGPPTAALQRHAAGETLQHWLALAGVGLTVSWTGATPDMAWRSGGLFGALGMKLLLAASRVDGWALCAGCGKPHVPSRQARRGSGRFCSDCRTAKVPARTRASRRYDARRTDPAFRQRERERLRAYRERQRAPSEEVG